MDLPTILERQRMAFNTQPAASVAVRRRRLDALDRMIAGHEPEWIDALKRDFGKPGFETFITEIAIVRKEIAYHRRHVGSWSKPRRVRPFLGNLPASERVHPQPFGVCLILGAWNYPLNLTMQPLVGALSAGNHVVLKPSELASNTAALIAKLAGRYFDPEVLTVVEGGPETGAMLTAMPFDLIFYTGSTRVGRLVAKAAAENLVPVVLELGGKSPAIVHHDADLEVAARRIWWGKCLNAGQTCVAPDYLLVHESVKERFVEWSRKVLDGFYPAADGRSGGRGGEGADGLSGERAGERYGDLARIINESHYQRITRLFDPSEALIGGRRDESDRFIEPTLIEAGDSHPLMQEEIFGPVMPMLTYHSEEEIHAHVERHPKPLAFYVFTRDDRFARRLIDTIPFGGGCVNDTISQLANLDLPFGGQGNSGMGAYHGKAGFDTFSRSKSIVHRWARPDLPVKYPPYTAAKWAWIRRLLKFA